MTSSVVKSVLGILPNDWSVAQLSSLLLQHYSGDWGLDSAGIRKFVLRSTNFTSSGNLNLSDIAVRYLSVKSANSLELRKGDLLLERSGGGPDQPVGRIAFVRAPMPEYAFSNFIQLLRPNQNEINPIFLGWVLYWINQSAIVERYSHQTTQLRNLNYRDYLRALIPNPPRDEQERIAQILDAVDTAIARTRDTLAKAERLRTSLTQKLFTRGIHHTEYRNTELGLIPKSWEVVRVDDIITEAQYGLSMPMSSTGKYPILRMAAIQDGDVKLDDLKYVDLPENIATSYMLKRGDILFNRTNSGDLVGKVGVYRSNQDAVFASYLIRLKVDPAKIDSFFLGELLASYAVQCRIKRYATPGVQQVNVNARNLRLVKIALPLGEDGLKEQKHIAVILEQHRQTVTRLFQRIELLQTVKRGLMQDLLTGRVRVTHKKQGAIHAEAAALRLKTGLALSAVDLESFRRSLLPSSTLDLLNKMAADTSATNVIIESFARSNAAVFQQMRDSVARILEETKPPLVTAKMIEEANRSIRMALEGIPSANNLIFTEVAQSSAWISSFKNLDQWGAAATAMQKHFAEIASVSNSAWERFARINWDALKEISAAVRLPQPSMLEQLQTFSHSYTELQSFIGQRLDFVAAWPPEITRWPTVEMYRATDLAYVTSAEEKDQELDVASTDHDDELERLLARLDPNLPQLLRGARHALVANHPDHTRHFSISLRELVTHVLHKIAPDEAVKGWSNEPQYLHNGRPTRRARILYICRQIHTPEMSTFLEEDVKTTLSFIDLFQEGTHAVQPSFNDKQIKAMLLKAEGLLRYLIELARL